MPTNKNASIRYQALDKCFQRTNKKYFIEDLIEACNEALYEFNGLRRNTKEKSSVKRRQIFDDIKYMESEAGWQIPLERKKEGKRTYYHYSDPMKIKLLFSKEVKDVIKDYNLHPTQKMKQNPDGTTTVSLEAGGRYEI